MTGLPAAATPWLHDTARVVARWLYRPLYRLSIRGTEHVPRTGPVVLIANHSSLIEPQLIFGMLPRRPVFLVKEELFTGVLGWGLRRIGQIPVRRNAPSRTALLAATGILRGGGVIAMFPEGTRGSGDVTQAQQGAAWLVRNTNALVLPVAVRGTVRSSRGPWWFRPPVHLLFGEPFELGVGPGRSGLVEATECIRETLAELVRTLDRDREGSTG